MVFNMTRRKSVCSKWTLVLVLFVCPLVYSRPQESVPTELSSEEKTTGSPLRQAEPETSEESSKVVELPAVVPDAISTSRNVKTKSPPIGDSITKVANQLLDKPTNDSSDAAVPDTRVPPKIKTQFIQKQKIRTRNEDGEQNEYSHAGVAVPVTMEELENENKVPAVESSTSNEGISTWILLSNPPNKDNSTTEPTKIEDNKKPKPTKNKTKRPQTKPSLPKRPIVGSTNKSDLVASGSAINENVYNKIKDTVMTNVQKNKSSPPRTTTTTTTPIPSTETTVKKEVTKEPSVVIPVIKVTSKPGKKKEKIKHKTSTTLSIPNESAMLPMEPKEQEIELEVSTPATTTKKPKRTSVKKKTKTKKRKTSKPKPTAATAVTAELKTANKTKSTKTSKKPTTATGPFTSQIYSYFSREVMPSVGVGVIGLAGLVGLASYFLYPFATPVRRTFEVDKKDDIYRNNAEEYANEGNGQPEEEMLSTVIAGMPAHAKHKLNPYAAQTAYTSRYPVKKEQQDIRYRHVAPKYEPNYNAHYPQQKTGIAHGAVYNEPLNYHQRPQYDTRHAYTTPQYETRHAYTTSYPAVEPIYAAPQTGPSDISSYGSDTSGSVVYGVKPAADTDFKPVYPYDNQFYSETTSSAVTHSPTSMYLGSNNEAEESNNNQYADETEEDAENGDNKFVVGNVPKELSDSATPAVVPEHGPRKLNRKRRGIAIEEVLEEAKEKEKDAFLSNEIDDSLNMIPMNLPSLQYVPKEEQIKEKVVPIYAVSVDPKETEADTTTMRNDIVESVSTMPVDDAKNDKFRIYEVYSTDKSAALTNEVSNVETESTFNTETTTEFKSDASTRTPSKSQTTTARPTLFPEILTYPPPSNGSGFFDFLQRLVDFKYRLGLHILQNTSDSLNRYLRSMEETLQRATKKSH
ncbi:cell wall protein DAN4-like isoform X1 [Colias croceus]|uniref:cell wall protein DAN4-like isoform X1 n=2 Tax=Colias crocea TaxID=72248 RepID=UPI001E27B584|nr:cell wall protein DAN4-like isoform X1 [Colias croceus]